MPKPNQQNQDTKFSVNSNLYFALTNLAWVVIVNYCIIGEELELVVFAIGLVVLVPIAPFVEIGYSQALDYFIPTRRKAASEMELQTSLRETDELLVELPAANPYSSLLLEERENLKRELEKSNPETVPNHQIRDAIINNNFEQAIELTKKVILKSAEDYPDALNVWLAEFNNANDNYTLGTIDYETAQRTFNRLNLLLLEFINDNLKT